MRSLVIRQECASLGPAHVDTAAAAHNLGCVLDNLGQSARALQLLDQARDLLSEVLGHEHPRTLVAVRNAQHVRHRPVQVAAGSGHWGCGTAGGAVQGGGGEDEGEEEWEEGQEGGMRRKASASTAGAGG